MQHVAVIMAGGKGQRFWPLSTMEKPKQFLDLEGCGRSLLQQTYDRLLPVSQVHKIFVATTANYVNLVKAQLPDLAEDNILVEPESRDSAAAIALASMTIEQRFGNVITGFFPADHHIAQVSAFQQTLRQAITMTHETQGIITLGIQPTRPATGFGYIDAGAARGAAFKVNRFVEKPDKMVAQRYLDRGGYYWNAGMFLWHCQTLLQELELHAPELYYPLRQGFHTDQVDSVYARLPKISIDYALMEHTDKAYVMPGVFGWDDVGDWVALERLLSSQQKGDNTLVGQHFALNAHNNLLFADPGDTLVTLGVDNIILVKQGNTVLLANKDHMQDIKQLLNGSNTLGHSHTAQHPDATL